MSKYFISPTTDTDLDVSPENLKTALLAEWPDIEIEDIDEGNRLFTWSRSAEHGLFDGYLNRKRQVVVLDGDVRDCASFAQWYRPLVENSFELVFYDDSYTNSVALNKETVANELIDPFL